LFNNLKEIEHGEEKGEKRRQEEKEEESIKKKKIVTKLNKLIHLHLLNYSNKKCMFKNVFKNVCLIKK